MRPRTVHLQDSRRSALLDEDNEPLCRLRPDAVIEDESMSSEDIRPIILDTKWKHLEANAGDRKFGVSQSDVYQMLAYAQAYNAQRLVLLYPWRKELGEQVGVNRRWTIAGTERRLDIATVDVSRPCQVIDTLRAIVNCNGTTVSVKAA